MTYFYLQENFAARRKTKSTAATIVCVVWSFWILICANLSILNKQVIRRNKNSTLKSHSPFLKFEGSATLVMIHKPKWKARARGYKSFFPVQILQHPVSVIIFSNIYKKINARIIGLTNQIKSEYESMGLEWLNTTCSWKRESKRFLTPLSKFMVLFHSKSTSLQRRKQTSNRWPLGGVSRNNMHVCRELI